MYILQLRTNLSPLAIQCTYLLCIPEQRIWNIIILAVRSNAAYASAKLSEFSCTQEIIIILVGIDGYFNQRLSRYISRQTQLFDARRKRYLLTFLWYHMTDVVHFSHISNVEYEDRAIIRTFVISFAFFSSLCLLRLHWQMKHIMKKTLVGNDNQNFRNSLPVFVTWPIRHDFLHNAVWRCCDITPLVRIRTYVTWDFHFGLHSENMLVIFRVIENVVLCLVGSFLYENNFNR